jgi:RNA polymerase sigma factor (sigma-70 family)
VTAREIFDANLEWAAVIARNVARKLPPSFDAGDLVQEAHIELWKRAQSYDPVIHARTHGSAANQFQGYAYLAVRGACLMACRRRAYRDSTHEEIVHDHGSHEARADERLIARHDDKNLRRCQLRKLTSVKVLIETLPGFEAYLVRRIYLDGTDIEDMAVTCGQPRQVLARRLASAVRRLRKAV